MACFGVDPLGRWVDDHRQTDAMALPAGSLLEHTPQGLYCRAAAAWIGPVGPVPRALITHAHADHARPGCGEY